MNFLFADLLSDVTALVLILALFKARPNLYLRARGYLDRSVLPVVATLQADEVTDLEEFSEEDSEVVTNFAEDAALLALAEAELNWETVNLKLNKSISTLKRIAKLHRPVGANAGIKLARKGLDDIQETV